MAGTVDQYTDPDWNDVAGTVDILTLSGMMWLGRRTDPDWNDVAGTAY